ncbi:hypothetical protein RS84_00717 [Microbacterium hydrocarbonoxydans]|uniref:Acid-resistance membrane protein n=1 Tax=Microbacterium hydrocarbonoxydans TaxID=273678 RepID=A0A0M2HQP8_9MICO|nr:hypothetical protein [Microbacterium hydrocarbonoxydans]KJL49087.1 hypothetical protein RS84_00717 [Microbacterium hydrocarbonoxydans]
MTTSAPTTSLSYARALRSLYVVRFAFAIVWVGVMFATSATAAEPNPLLTALLIAYPLFDAGAVLWQLRADPDRSRTKAAEWTGVIVSLVIAVALGIASSISLSAALAVWGVWAIIAGAPQLITAIRNRRNGGQVAQMLSGGISLFAGAGFLFQGLQGGGMIAGVAGYAGVGAVFFLISAIVLSIRLKRESA